MKLLSISNYKTMKGEGVGYRTFTLSFAPSKVSGYQVCPAASPKCSELCLFSAGRGQMHVVQNARVRKTRWFFEDRVTFMEQLVKDIETAIRQSDRVKLIPVFRLNTMSDIRWESVKATRGGVEYRNVMEAFPSVLFYDYTKLWNRRNIPSNYRLVFSRSETNESFIRSQVLFTRTNVAVVFNTRKNDSLPSEYMGRQVVDGDLDDLRFLDPEGVIVGLRAKGRAIRRDGAGFVVSASNVLRVLQVAA
jgi:hypothetical protein